MRFLQNVVVPLFVVLILIAISFLCFTAYIAYCCHVPLGLPTAFDAMPHENGERLGGLLDSALNWSMRVCGAVVTILGAGLALRRGSLGQSLSSCIVALAGVALITQHWAAGIALAVVAVAFVIGIVMQKQTAK